jgi:hypothetical protein
VNSSELRANEAEDAAFRQDGRDGPRSGPPPGTTYGDLGDPHRLAAIARLGLHGHLGDPHLDAVVATVAAACDVPLAVVNIVTPGLQTYPAEIGVGACSTGIRWHVRSVARAIAPQQPRREVAFSAPSVRQDPPRRSAGAG